MADAELLDEDASSRNWAADGVVLLSLAYGVISDSEDLASYLKANASSAHFPNLYGAASNI